MPSLPPEAVLRAAGRWLRQLQFMSVPRCQSFFVSHPRYGDLTLTQYGLALHWLREIGVVTREGALSVSAISAELTLLQRVLIQAQPSWLPDADQLVLIADDLPEDVASAGEALGLKPQETLAAVRTAWGKVDTTLRSEIGLAGEKALAALLSELAGVTVTHVAEYADGLGYDIVASDETFWLNLEVKTTTRRGRLTLYLSRNEYEVMRIDPCWRLIVILLNPERDVSAVGAVDPAWVRQHSPADTSPHGRWDVTRLEIPPGVVRPGISDLCARTSPQHLLFTGIGESPPVWLAM